MSQWSRGSMTDCSATGPGIESRCVYRKKNHSYLQPWARAVCTLPEPSTLRETINEYQLSD